MANIDNEKTSKKSPVKPLEMSKLGLGGKSKSRWPSKAKQEHISKSVGSTLDVGSLNIGDRQKIKPGEEAGMANQMRQDKKEERSGTPPRNKEKGGTLRQLRKKAKELSKKGKMKMKSGASGERMPSTQKTSALLRQSWIILVESGGTSFPLWLLYINVHIFLGAVAGKKLFCKLGDEWPLPEIQRKKIGFGEIVLVAFVDLLVVFVLLIAIAMVMIVIEKTFGFWLKAGIVILNTWDKIIFWD